MTDKEKIRKEVEKLHGNPYYMMAVKDVLAIIDSIQEPASEDLEEASKEWLIPQLDKSYANYGEVKMMELTHFDGYAMLDAIEFGAKWQRQKDEHLIWQLSSANYEKGKQEVIDKTCEFLKSYRRETRDGMGYVAGIIDDDTIEDFKKLMKD